MRKVKELTSVFTAAAAGAGLRSSLEACWQHKPGFASAGAAVFLAFTLITILILCCDD